MIRALPLLLLTSCAALGPPAEMFSTKTTVEVELDEQRRPKLVRYVSNRDLDVAAAWTSAAGCIHVKASNTPGQDADAMARVIEAQTAGTQAIVSAVVAAAGKGGEQVMLPAFQARDDDNQSPDC